jgi:hypothetical protein
MNDRALTKAEIDEFLSSIDERHEKKQELRKEVLKRNALTAWGVIRAIRDARIDEYRINFTLIDEEAEALIIRYAKNYKTGR